MTKSFRNDLFIRAARGERTERTPIWLMRQAGRTDPAYNKLKAEAGMPLEDLFHNAELAAQISLLPRRLGIDAIIYFQDILTILWPMGAQFRFRPGPVIEEPIRTPAQVRALREYDMAQELPYIPETFRLIYKELDGEMPVLGFAGAPLTLLFFLVEGKSFGAKAQASHAFLREEPKLAHELLDKIAALTVDYLKLQIDAGAAAFQLFESAAHLLDKTLYREFALPYQQQIFQALKGTIPSIAFAREWENLDTLNQSGADIISLPSSISVAQARKALGEERVFQGNVDKHLLASGTLDQIEQAAKACVQSGGHRGHILNLNHGLLRETPYENILHLTKVVRETRC